jgi:hypothetical protein
LKTQEKDTINKKKEIAKIINLQHQILTSHIENDKYCKDDGHANTIVARLTIATKEALHRTRAIKQKVFWRNVWRRFRQWNEDNRCNHRT